MPTDPPCVFVVAGPNGAGKSTTAPALLRDRLRLHTYVNADSIATGLSAFEPEAAAFQAGRIMLTRLDELRHQRANFAFETTLATRGYAPWLVQCRQQGFRVGLLFLSLPTVEIAVERVADRVRSGGHNIPEAVVKRRFVRGLKNFFELYRELADRWLFFDNGFSRPLLLAHGGPARATVVKQSRYLDLEGIHATRRP